MQVPQEMMVRYIQRRKKDLEMCLASFEEEKFEELEKVGHQLKGNGRTFGHNDLTEIGMTMEQAAHERDRRALEDALKQFSHWVQTH